MRQDLHLDWCSYEAAKYAVEHWHYSRTMPISKLVKIGVWESEKFIGSIIYGGGASANIHKIFQCERIEVCELLRVALNRHQAPVTKMISISMRMLRGFCPNLRVIVSFADPEHGHVGSIYQAGNWIYIGEASPGMYYRTRSGKLIHNRKFRGPQFLYGPSQSQVQSAYTAERRRMIENGDLTPVMTRPKYKYVMPLDEKMRILVKKLSKPYPKKMSAESIEADASGYQPEEGGSIPTSALQEQA